MITLFAIVSLAAAPAASGHLFSPPQAAGCGGDYAKVKTARPVGFTPLGALPDAHLEIALNRMVGGCPAPIIIRYNVSK